MRFFLFGIHDRWQHNTSISIGNSAGSSPSLLANAGLNDSDDGYNIATIADSFFAVCACVRVVLYVWPCRVVHRCRRILLCPNRFHSSTRPSSSPVIDPEQNFRLVLLAIHAEFYPDRLGSAETMAFLSRRNGYRLLPELGRAQLGGSGAQLGAGARERRHRLRSRGQRGGEKPLSFWGAPFSHPKRCFAKTDSGQTS
jgi:hypothetical protein